MTSKEMKATHEAYVARVTLRRVWVAACAFEGVEPSESFVVFSTDNPHLKGMREASKTLIAALNTLKAARVSKDGQQVTYIPLM